MRVASSSLCMQHSTARSAPAYSGRSQRARAAVRALTRPLTMNAGMPRAASSSSSVGQISVSVKQKASSASPSRKPRTMRGASSGRSVATSTSGSSRASARPVRVSVVTSVTPPGRRARSAPSSGRTPRSSPTEAAWTHSTGPRAQRRARLRRQRAQPLGGRPPALPSCRPRRRGGRGSGGPTVDAREHRVDHVAGRSSAACAAAAVSSSAACTRASASPPRAIGTGALSTSATRANGRGT